MMLHDDFKNMKKLKGRTFLKEFSANCLIMLLGKANRLKCLFNILSYTFIILLIHNNRESTNTSSKSRESTQQQRIYIILNMPLVWYILKSNEDLS